MVKVNIERYLEAECPRLNKHEMEEQNRTHSPGLKVQIFLNQYEAQKAYTGHKGKDKCTKVVCPIITTEGLCYKEKTCLYSFLTKENIQI